MSAMHLWAQKTDWEVASHSSKEHNLVSCLSDRDHEIRISQGLIFIIVHTLVSNLTLNGVELKL